jgi:N-acetylneuraminic acid mutarotase
MSQTQLEKKVEDYLRNSQALEDYWQRPITAEQLQAEMDRMAQHTKQSEVLREVFEALGNDPFVIAECLARPALAQRLLTNWYGYDQRIHGELRQRAEVDLQGHSSVDELKQTSGKYSEIELVKGDRNEHNRGSNPGLELSPHEWNETLYKLAAMFGKSKNNTRQPHSVHSSGDSLTPEIEAELLNPLQEDNERYYAIAVLDKTKDRLKLATIEWAKEPLESWRARAENQVTQATAAAADDYTLPEISDGGCTDDTWTATMVNGPSGRSNHTAVWTGSEMIIWGGGSTGSELNTGGRYNPSTDMWTATSTANAPSPRYAHTAIWTGSEMIVWGGYGYDFGGYLNTGGRYDPTTDSWTATSTTNAPSAREGQTAVWTGGEMIVWGGYGGGTNELNTGARYSPDTNSWNSTTVSNAPAARSGHTAVWTGREMIVWGGRSGDDFVNTGSRYSPITDSWTPTAVTNAPSGRILHTAVWTGDEMIVWGGGTNIDTFNTGGRYNPGTDSWVPTSIINAPSPRAPTAVWTGSEMIIWSSGGNLNTGGRYHPNTDSWIAISNMNAPGGGKAVWTGSEMIVWGSSHTGGRYDPETDIWVPIAEGISERWGHTAVWTGSEMMVWGGIDSFSNFLNSGGRYNPVTDTWIATSTINAPDGRYGATAVWTGSDMIAWGGIDSSNFLNTGGKYNPSTDSWVATSTANAPDGRPNHTAVWTGSEMIIWGGGSGLNTGGRYDPSTDSWTATNMTSAPTARYLHTAVWTGSEMIVWGGGYFFDNLNWYLNTGGRYNPSTDSWTATSTTNVPGARQYHSAVWTGDEMIVWGGSYDDRIHFFDLNTGGRYNPSTDSWMNTQTDNAPSARAYHTAVWTGSEMIVWGGSDGDSSLNTGGIYCAQSGIPTPTPTPIVTPTPTPTPTPSQTPTPTATATPTPSPTPSVPPTPTVTPTATPTVTPTATPTSTPTASPRQHPTPRPRPTPPPRP